MPESSAERYRDQRWHHESAKIVRGHDHAFAVYATSRLVDVLAHPISVVNVCRRFWKFVYSSALPRRHTELVTDLFLAEGAARGEVGLSFGNRLECVWLGQTASLHPLRPDPRWLRRSPERSLVGVSSRSRCPITANPRAILHGDRPGRESHQHVYIHLRWLPALQNVVGYRSPHRQAIGTGQNLHRVSPSEADSMPTRCSLMSVRPASASSQHPCRPGEWRPLTSICCFVS